MSRELVFLSVNDHNNIFSHQLAEVSRQFRKQLAGCKLLVQYTSGVLNISAPVSMVDAVSSIKGVLLRECYFKLGCSQITLYCMGEHLFDYNWHESTTHAESYMSTATIERPTTTTVTTDKFIALERAAQALNLNDEELLDLLAKRDIPVIVRNRQPWGMNADAARTLLEWNYHQQLIAMGLEYDDENPAFPPIPEAVLESIPAEVPAMIAESQAEVQAEPTLEPEQFAAAVKNGASETSTNSNVLQMPPAAALGNDMPAEMSQEQFWQMPENVELKPKSRTTFKEALRIGLMSLEYGDRFFLERLKCLKSPRKYTEAKAFLELIVAKFRTKPDINKAIGELMAECKANPLPPSAS